MSAHRDRSRGHETAGEHRHDHDHAHEHAHDHAHDRTEPPSRAELRIKALESLLVAKGVVDSAALDEVIDRYEHQVGPRNGARVVARAWVDSDYRTRLLTDANAAIAELDLPGDTGDRLVLVENTDTVHNVIVCTLCSCYPWHTLGLPPNWYKSAAYRSRVVIDPRGVLAEFGLHLPEEVEVRVWDSNADIRYMVLPRRPEGSEGFSEQQLALLVTRDSMIGTGLPRAPGRSEP
jgi:nitrile hydratase